jgi:hypothetical protein
MARRDCEFSSCCFSFFVAVAALLMLETWTLPHDGTELKPRVAPYIAQAAALQRPRILITDFFSLMHLLRGVLTPSRLCKITLMWTL